MLKKTDNEEWDIRPREEKKSTLKFDISSKPDSDDRWMRNEFDGRTDDRLTHQRARRTRTAQPTSPTRPTHKQNERTNSLTAQLTNTEQLDLPNHLPTPPDLPTHSTWPRNRPDRTDSPAWPHSHTRTHTDQTAWRDRPIHTAVATTHQLASQIWPK